MRLALQGLVLVLLAPNAFAKAPAPPPPARGTLITVVTAGWAATTGELQAWERDGKKWRAVGGAVAVVVGKSGLKTPPKKREGDGASPAGRFALGEADGYDVTAPEGIKLHYEYAGGRYCIDDPKRADYNTVQFFAHEPDNTEPPLPYEKMRRDDGLYRYTIFVKHNVKRAPKLGSCIFLHVWRDASSPTVGCTAMALDDLRALLMWVEPSTMLVQLPRGEYARRQRAWGLPPLAQRK
jgi:L,D-peptidoglycan transpeptidase YkuD (ErfK/YbiS/YcfS/YnhG family)